MAGALVDTPGPYDPIRLRERGATWGAAERPGFVIARD